jgi:hypothetical protein
MKEICELEKCGGIAKYRCEVCETKYCEECACIMNFGCIICIAKHNKMATKQPKDDKRCK